VRLHVACDNDVFPPLFGATQRLFGLARGMAARAGVRVLCVVPNRSRGASTQRVANLELCRVRSWHTSVAWWLERAGVAPMFTAERGHRARAERYRALLGERPDVLMCDLPLTGMLPGAAPALRVYHAHNVEAERWRSTAPRVWRRAHWGEALAALERRAVADSDCCVACTDEDAGLLRSRHGARDVIVAPNGYDETALAPASAEARARARVALGIAPEAYVAAFVGGDWAPNHEALAWLVERVMPALAREAIVLLAVGAVARAFASRREPWLVTRPATPDLASLLAAADAGLNPVTSGGGSNVKVPTYLGMGLAVVSTPFGLRGYAPLAPSVVSAERDAFADALRARPRGWAARGEPRPGPLADLAWGAIGARLADALATRIRDRERGPGIAPAAGHSPGVDPALPAGRRPGLDPAWPAGRGPAGSKGAA